MPATHRKASGNGGLLDALNERARARPVDNFSSIQTYYRSAALWARQADLYRKRYGGEEQLYVMLMRFVSLVVETLPKHRAFSAADPKYRQLRQDAIRYMDEVESLKASLQLNAVVKQLAGADSDRAVFLPTKVAGTVPLSAGNLPELHWEAAAAPAPPPPAGAALGVPQPEGFDLLAGLGLTGAAVAASSSSAATAALPGLPAPQQPAFPELPELSPSIRLPAASQATLAKHALLPAGYGSSLSAAPAAQQRPAAQPQQQQQQQQPRPLYPELAALEPPPPPEPPVAALAALDVSASVQPQQGASPPPPPPQPSPYNELALGPQEVGVVSAPRPTQPLPPDSTCCAPGAGAVVPAPPPSGGVAEVKRLQTLRDVHVSVALMDEFMRYAISNTRRGIETCGILAGSLSADDAVFTITTLIVPKQTGTTDTVEMLGEEEIFEVQDSRALYPLGWIHTHPTQTCFLSSVDIHTHCGFQTMLDEAVAVVMAPRDPSKRVGIFRLSTPGGLKLVQRCPQRGFHAHPPTDSGQPIYELCGHVYLNPRAGYEVVDLR